MHKLVEQLFCFKRNHKASLQPMGTSLKYRPKDATLTQHQAATWLAAELLVRARERHGPTHTYVPLAIADAPTWQKKRGYEATVDRDSATPLIPRQAKRRCSTIPLRPERVQALWAVRAQRREALAKAAALTAAKMALHAAQAATKAAQLQAAA